jgi:hypothetical protein
MQNCQWQKLLPPHQFWPTRLNRALDLTTLLGNIIAPISIAYA